MNEKYHYTGMGSCPITTYFIASPNLIQNILYRQGLNENLNMFFFTELNDVVICKHLLIALN